MGAKLIGVEISLPKKRITNKQLERDFPGYSFENFEKKVGIESRYISKGESTLDLGVSAANKLFDKYGIEKSSIDYLIFCTQSPEYFLPTTACLAQERLSLRNDVGAIDINLGCSAFPYAYNIASKLLDGRYISRVLIITSETYSRYIHKEDRANRAIFGDAGAASLVEFVDSENYIFFHGTDGSGADNLIVKNGCRIPYDSNAPLKHYGSENHYTDNNLYMNGPEVLNFTLTRIPSFYNYVLKSNHLNIDQIDFVVFHQANKFMLEMLRKNCGIPKEKFLVHMAATGNTVSSTIPIVLANLFDNLREEARGKDLRVLVLGFGVGLSWSGGVLEL